MKEHQLLLKDWGVTATLAGTKTQTRRVIQTRPENNTRVGTKAHQAHIESPEAFDHCPYGKPGGVLWVRETWAVETVDNATRVIWKANNQAQYYNAEAETLSCIHDPFYMPSDYKPDKWKPSIFMPKEYCRLFLEVTDIRVERVQDISYKDAKAEGILVGKPRQMELFGADLAQRKYIHDIYARLAMQPVWDSINADRGYGWTTNPWVWVIEYRIKVNGGTNGQEAKG